MKVARLVKVFIVVSFLAVTGAWAQGTTGSEQAPSVPPQPTIPGQDQPNPQQTTKAAEQDFQVPDSYIDRVKKEGAVLELTMKDAIRLALTNNLDLEIQNYNEDLSRMRVFGTKGYYDPVLQFSLGWRSNANPNTNVLDAGAQIPISLNKSWTFSTALTQNVLGGGQFLFNFDNSKATTNSVYQYVNPQYGSNFLLQFTQPLWSGFRETQTERQLKIYNLDTKISDSQFKQAVARIIQRVENQYWGLVYAIQNYEARRRSLEMAIITYRNNQKRVEIGVMAPIEITSSRAEVASREQDMISSEVQIIQAQNAMKNLLAPDPRATLWSETLIPTDEPEVKEVQVTLNTAVDTALQNRPELEQLSLQLEQSDVDRKFYYNQGKPQVNLVFGLTSLGTAGTVYALEGGGIGEPGANKVPQPDSPFYGGIGNSLGQAFGFEYLSYNARVNVQIPLRNRSNEAQLAQNAINKRSLESQVKSQQQAIIVDVRNAYEGIATQRKALDAARLARQLAQEQLDGENKRFEAGLSTNFEVLRYQRDLVTAQVNELGAMVNYQQALTALQTAMFTIVNENDFVTARRDQ